MAELIMYNNKIVTIGTCENLYYVSYKKFKDALEAGKLKGSHFYPASEYLTVKYGYRFRFPFPDEDKLSFSDIKEGSARTIPVKVSNVAFSEFIDGKHEHETYTIGIQMQQPLFRASDGKFCLALLYREPTMGRQFTMEDDHEVKILLKEIIKNHITNEPDVDTKNFYRRVAVRILKGFSLTAPAEKMLQNQKVSDRKNSRPELNAAPSQVNGKPTPESKKHGSKSKKSHGRNK